MKKFVYTLTYYAEDRESADHMFQEGQEPVDRKVTECQIKDDELEDMWEELGDVPVNDDGEILRPFYFWDKGTHRGKIWHWFDEHLTKGVAYLMAADYTRSRMGLSKQGDSFG